MEELNEIKEKFKEVLSYSQGTIINPKVDKLFDLWMDAKSKFIEKMGGKLIYEFPEKITFTLGEKDREKRVNDFITVVMSRYNNTPLADFLYTIKNSFFDNILPCDYTYKGKTITKGKKIIKAFKYFEEDKSLLTDIQNHASRIIQEDKIEGRLCVSVHPLDFLSLSENTHHWRSCHALDGEYRSGNLSYMTDKSTVICYLKSEEDDFLPRFPYKWKWNSKKWRTLIYFSDDRSMLMAGRQYPFFAETGLDCIINKLLPASGLLPKNFSLEWHHNYLESMDLDNGETVHLQSYIPIGSALISIQDLVTDVGRLHYNDLLYSSCYTPYYAYLKHADWIWTWDCPTGFTSPSTRFFIGGEVPCPHCERGFITMNESMCCDNCYVDEEVEDEDIAYCDICGSSMPVEISEWVDGSLLCPHCYETLTGTCDKCGRRVMESELVYDRELKKTLCLDCRLDIAEEEE